MRDLETSNSPDRGGHGSLVFALEPPSAPKTIEFSRGFPAAPANKIGRSVRVAPGIVGRIFQDHRKPGGAPNSMVLVDTPMRTDCGKTHQIPGMRQVGKKRETALDDAIRSPAGVAHCAEESLREAIDKTEFRALLPHQCLRIIHETR